MSNKYVLVRKTNSSPDIFVQEYVHGNEDPDHFSEMISIELVLQRENTRDVVVRKAEEIQSRKNTDPFAQYNIGEDTVAHEMLFDFQFSEGTGDQAMAEWNICRYKLYHDAKGNSGYTVLRWVRRSYGPLYQTVPEQLTKSRKSYVHPFMALKYPEVHLK